MSNDDHVLSDALRRAAVQPDTGGVYERVVRRRARYRLRKRMAAATLAATILVVMGAATWTLARSFGIGTNQPATNPPPTGPVHSLAPTTDPGPTTPAGSPSPTPPATTCRDTNTVRGDLDGNGEQELARLLKCGDAWFVELDRMSPSQRWELPLCELACALLAAPDLDGDGTDELALAINDFTFPDVALFDASSDERGPVAITIAPPGDPAGQFEPGSIARFGFGGDAFSTYNVICEDRPEGRVLVATAAESLPHDRVDARWHVHETVLRYVSSEPRPGGGSFEVVKVHEYTLPTGGPEDQRLFADHEHICGAPTVP